MYKEIDDKIVMEVCENSGLSDFISEVSLDYVVGQNGAMLSGGQKQKIALARALVQNSPIVILMKLLLIQMCIQNSRLMDCFIRS